MTSKIETFGVATIEAMSCGLPVILSKNAGSMEIKRNIKNTIIYNPNNALALFEQMYKDDFF